MPYNFPEIKRFKGLHLQANSFDLPDGALEDCNNAVISKDGIVSKLRGNYSFLNGSSNILKALAMYKDTLFAICTDKVLSVAKTGTIPNETGTGTALLGKTVAVSSQARTLEQNNNLYMTSDNGVLKLESATSVIRSAGVPPALDLNGTLLPANGVINGDSKYGWRVIFGRRDANQNLLLGAPSDFLFMQNKRFTAAYSSNGVKTTITTSTGSVHGLGEHMTVTIALANGTGQPTVLNGEKLDIHIESTTSFSFLSGATTGTGTCEFYNTRAARIEFSIPAEINDVADGYFYQVYRTSSSGSQISEPSVNFSQIDEVALKAADISAAFIVYNDVVDDLFRGAELYTNTGSREGETQTNFQPPLAKDFCLFKNHIFYANATTRHALDMQVVHWDSTYLTTGDYVEVKVGSSTPRRYIGRPIIINTTTGARTSGTGNDRYTAVASGTGTITVTFVAHGLSNNDTVYVSNVTGTVPAGLYTITTSGLDAFTFSAPTFSATLLDFGAVASSAGYFIFTLYQDSVFPSASIRNTALGLVRAINRDASAPVYANYSSTNIGMPGQIRLTAINFGVPFSLRANTATAGSAFTPALPTSFSTGTQVTSKNDVKDAGFYSSKIGEGEAVPAVNFYPVGSQNKKLLRIVALRDSVLCIKEDGIWRIDGDSVYNFAATALDKTTICLAPDSVDTINNQVVLLSNQGVCLATSNAVRIVSRDIETPIKAILGSPVLDAQTTGVAYESERLYFLTTIKPGSSVADQTYVYNTLSDAWSTCDYRITAGAVCYGDSLFWVDQGNVVLRERKNFDRTDFCGQNYSTTVNSISTDYKSASITTTAHPKAGDVLILNSVVNRITDVSILSTNLWSITFRTKTSLQAGDSPILYAGYDATVKLSPFHAGAVGRMKQFSQMQLHMRDNSMKNLNITFGGQAYGSSPTVNWISESIDSSAGWGLSPWGLFGWGQTDSTAITYKSEQAPVVRIYIPLISQRSTYIQPIIVHPNAAEEMNMQAVTFAVRGYNERVSK